MITILNYGMGNLGSICSMLSRIGVEAEIVDQPEAVRRARKLLLPGVGAFDAAMSRIEAGGFRGVLDELALERRIPVLGICLGMQLLTRGSEEGRLPGLGWIAGEARRFPTTAGLPVPHMGWNVVREATPSPLTQGLGAEPRFYFVHSFYVRVDDEKDSNLKTTYGVTFDSAVHRDNIYGAQFHPEKSHRFGLQLLTNFARL
jgi:imidazole glycerol-phosphate synthase subunit HisH